MGNDSIGDDDLNGVDHQSEHHDDAEAFGLEEPTDDFDHEVEWLEEPSPWELWERYRDGESESDRIQQLFDALIALRCNELKLLEALLTVKRGHYYWAASRRRLLKFAEVVHQAREHEPLSIGDGFSNDSWITLQDLLRCYEEHLRAEAERAKRNPDRARTRALYALLGLVEKSTGDFQYQLLSELLCLFVDEKLTYDNLRQIATRAELPKCRAAKPQIARSAEEQKRTQSRSQRL
jgi:hypothetical protein